MGTETLLVIATAAIALCFFVLSLMQWRRIGWLEAELRRAAERINGKHMLFANDIQRQSDAQAKESKRLDEVRNMALKDISDFQSSLSKQSGRIDELAKAEVTFKELFKEQKQANLHLQERIDQQDKRIDNDRLEAIETDKQNQEWRSDVRIRLDGVDSKLAALNPAGSYTIGSHKPLRQDVNVKPDFTKAFE